MIFVKDELGSFAWSDLIGQNLVYFTRRLIAFSVALVSVTATPEMQFCDLCQVVS